MTALIPLDAKDLVDDPDSYFLCREAVTSLGNIGASKDETATRLLKLLTVSDAKSDGRLVDELVIEVLITLGKIGKKAEPASNAIAQIAAKTSKQDVLEEAAIAAARGLARKTKSRNCWRMTRGKKKSPASWH